MKITSAFNENGRTLQDVMEQFLILFVNDHLDDYFDEKKEEKTTENLEQKSAKKID